jgi:hypothetical protein
MNRVRGVGGKNHLLAVKYPQGRLLEKFFELFHATFRLRIIPNTGIQTSYHNQRRWFRAF